MSTKTTFKRIALVTVAALGMGVLTSVSPASATTDGDSSDFTISSTTTTTNNGIVYASALTATKAYAEVLAGAKVVFTNEGATDTFGAGDKQVLTISGDATWTSWELGTAADSATIVLSADRKTLTASAGLNSTVLETAQLTVGSSATGTITVTTSGLVAGNSTLLVPNTYTLTVLASAAASAEGVYSVSGSNVQLTPTSAAVGTANEDQAGAGVALNGNSVYVAFSLKDVYGTALDAGILTASVTGGLYVGFDGTTPAAATAVKTNNTNGYVQISQGTANVAGSGTVTLTYNGTVVGTKSVKILGDLASITVTPKKIGQTGQSTTGGVGYELKDAAGNVLQQNTTKATLASQKWAITLDTTVASKFVSSYTAETSSIVINNTLAETSSADVLAGYGKLTCTSEAGKATGLKLKATNSAGAVIKSAGFDFSCAGDISTYTAAFDKASYATGAVATLTITAKDLAGNTANDAALAGAVTVTSGAFTSTDGTPVGGAVTGQLVNGVLTLKYVVGQTAGTYQAVVSVGNAAAASKVVTLPVTVTSAGASEIAQLVKVIGTLLTTFTKQIAALIKALGKR
jgi:hypothetical protein